MEKALFITHIKNLKYANSKYSRLYFGIEFCEKLIPQLCDLEKIIKYCDRNRLRFSLVTPYVTDIGLGKLEKLFFWLQNKGRDCEVIINDYGVLDLISEKYRRFKPVVGRLLTKQKRDPRILGLTSNKMEKGVFIKQNGRHRVVLAKKIPDALISYFREVNINVPTIQNFLSRYRIERAEIDNLLQGINLKIPQSRLSASLYVPYGYITTTRLCAANPFHYETRFFCRISSCRKECQKYIVELRNKNMSKVIYKKGNTLFFKNAKVPDKRELIKKGIDRLVYQPEIPI